MSEKGGCGKCSSCGTMLRDKNDLKPFREQILCFDCYRAQSEKAFNKKHMSIEWLEAYNEL